MNPNAGIWASFDFDLVSLATFPLLLALLPVLTTAESVATGTGKIDIGTLELAKVVALGA